MAVPNLIGLYLQASRIETEVKAYQKASPLNNQLLNVSTSPPFRLK
jgi:hypothetical protein